MLVGILESSTIQFNILFLMNNVASIPPCPSNTCKNKRNLHDLNLLSRVSKEFSIILLVVQALIGQKKTNFQEGLKIYAKKRSKKESPLHLIVIAKWHVHGGGRLFPYCVAYNCHFYHEKQNTKEISIIRQLITCSLANE